eukprot:TRINITY_DN5167_c2_g1_i2.p1 TRINITY_DN5167_c2_g1~~TRINITY_DN5167_c2_g1_i2.p1  ORF type:complete len:196 (+),score=21.95 TRINITY_DN5167_c2_g1_i2:41-628(+)
MGASSGIVSGFLIVALGGLIIALMGPQIMRGILEYSATDDDMAERCFEPSKGDYEWQECLIHKENASVHSVPAIIDGDFPTGGGQILADGYRADPDILNNNTLLLHILNSATECCGSTVLKHTDHAFEPQGATLLGLLSTSHYAVHTWPERSAFTLDVYFCTPNAVHQVLRFAKIFCEAVKAQECCYRTVRRPLL